MLPTSSSLTATQWTQACLNIQDGGLGLFNHVDIGPAAFAASLTECLHSLSTAIPHIDSLILQQDPSPTQTIQDYHGCIDFVSKFDPTVTLHTARNIKPSNDNTVQKQLSEKVTSKRYNELLSSMQDTSDIAWITSLTHPAAGLWLEYAPKSIPLSLPSTHFTVALCHRLRVPHPSITPGLTCDCTRKSKIDSHGLHILSGCNKDACRVALHDALKREFNTMFKWCGEVSIVEQRGAFQGINPDDHRRPDISIHIPGEPIIFTDISVTCPIPISTSTALSRKDAFTPGRAALVAQKRKMDEYGAVSTAVGAKFRPLIFELTGRPNNDINSVIKSFAEKQAISQGTRWDVVYRYWFARISVTFQFYTAAAILHRTRAIIQRATSATRNISDDTVNAFQFITAFSAATTRNLGTGGTASWSTSIPRLSADHHHQASSSRGHHPQRRTVAIEGSTAIR